MNFFEQQDRAHRNTRRLIFLLCIAVISLIAVTTLLFATVFYLAESNTHHYLRNAGLWQGVMYSMSWKMLAGISITVCAVIFLGGLYKFFQLANGGRAVAEAMGGRLLNIQTTDAHERKILNIVEEMAIASGTPVPPVYLLEDDAINAFAAGHTPQDAVIGITRGCITLLKRDELQGVVAHEFSHIFHGDMTLNMRLVALLNGILLLGLLGQFLLRSSGNSSAFRSERNKSSPAAMLGLGIGLIIIGYTGTFFGNLIKAAVSRQREFLADASAVKFTRNPEGIAGALKKIGGHSLGSQLHNENAAEFSHMYFSQGVHTAFNALMATHPALEERIKRIEPNWNGKFPVIKNDLPENTQENYSEIHNPETHRFIKTNNLIKEATQGFTSTQTTENSAFNVNAILESIGQPGKTHLAYAQKALNDIDENLRASAHNSWEAQILMFGLLLDTQQEQQEKQWQMLNNIFSVEQMEFIKPLATQVSSIAPQLRLPLVELSLPALKNLSSTQYQQFKYALDTLIHADQNINLFEWSLCRILKHNLEPQKKLRQQINLEQLQKESNVLLSAIAHAGAASVEDAQAAYSSSKKILGFADSGIVDVTDFTPMDLDIAVTRLNMVKPLQKPKLLKAMSECILHDGQVTAEEAELFRAIADALNCPVPPLVMLNK